jgi:hypothetical protein
MVKLHTRSGGVNLQKFRTVLVQLYSWMSTLQVLVEIASFFVQEAE